MNDIEKYLNDFFVSEEEFIRHSDCTIVELNLWQEHKIFPNPAYKTENAFVVDSIYGINQMATTTRWYSKGMYAWLKEIKRLKYKQSKVRAMFFERYICAIQEFERNGLCDPMFVNEKTYRRNLVAAWSGFLQGFYGVFTKNCSPEQIAAKDLATTVIDRITSFQTKETSLLCADDKLLLVMAVNILDEVSCDFAPHERNVCYRMRCIDLVRTRYLVPE